MGKGNPMIQVRVHPTIKEKVEARAKSLGFLKPDDEANLAEYVRSLIMRDINSGMEIIDGQISEYKIK